MALTFRDFIRGVTGGTGAGVAGEIPNPFAAGATATNADVQAELDRLKTPVTRDAGIAEARPILDAINKQAAYDRPAVRDNIFAGDAEAGFGLSGRAVQNVERGLGSFDAATTFKSENAIRQAMADIATRNQGAAREITDDATAFANKNANERRRFLGVF